MQAQEVFYGKQAYIVAGGRYRGMPSSFFPYTHLNSLAIFSTLTLNVNLRYTLQSAIDIAEGPKPIPSSFCSRQTKLSRWMNEWMNEWRLHDKWFVFLHIFNVYSNRIENRRRGAIHPSIIHSTIAQGTIQSKTTTRGWWVDDTRKIVRSD